MSQSLMDVLQHGFQESLEYLFSLLILSKTYNDAICISKLDSFPNHSIEYSIKALCLVE